MSILHKSVILILMYLAGLAILVMAMALPAHADPTFPQRNGSGVVDAGNYISVPREAALNAKVVAWNKRTGHQFVVATVPSLQGYPVAEYGTQLGRAWGLGRKDVNDGVILLLAPHKAFVVTGYGLEGVLPDGWGQQMTSSVMVPLLKAGRIEDAIDAGADALMAKATSEPTVVAAPSPAKSKGHLLGWLTVLLAGGLVSVLGFVLVRTARNKQREQQMVVEAALAREEEAERQRERDRQWAQDHAPEPDIYDDVANRTRRSRSFDPPLSQPPRKTGFSTLHGEPYGKKAKAAAPTPSIVPLPVAYPPAPSPSPSAPSYSPPPPSWDPPAPSYDPPSPSFDSGGGSFGGGGGGSDW